MSNIFHLVAFIRWNYKVVDKPCSDKYVVDLTTNGQEKHVLQLEATVFDMDKATEQESFRNSTIGLISNQAN